MFEINNLIINYLRFLSTKSSQSVIFFLLFSIALGIFISIVDLETFSLFGNAIVIIVSTGFFILFFLSTYCSNINDCIIVLCENLSNNNMQFRDGDEVQFLKTFSVGISSYSFSQCHVSKTYIYQSLNLVNIDYSNRYQKSIEEFDEKIKVEEENHYIPNKKLSIHHEKRLKNIYPKLEEYFISDNQYNYKYLLKLVNGEKILHHSDKIKLKKELSYKNFAPIFPLLGEAIGINMNQTYKLFLRYDSINDEYMDINLSSMKSVVSRWKKSINQ